MLSLQDYSPAARANKPRALGPPAVVQLRGSTPPCPSAGHCPLSIVQATGMGTARGMISARVLCLSGSLGAGPQKVLVVQVV